jgi:hypothetical protein
VRMSIPAGAEVRIGQPATPDRNLARSIPRLLASFPEVQEAHFPMCWAPGTMTRPAQVLMVVFSNPEEALRAVPRIHQGLAPLLGPGKFLDVWPVPAAGAFLGSVRSVGCQIFGRRSSGQVVIVDPWTAWKRTLRLFHPR